MSKPVVLLDVDGVLADFVQSYLDMIFQITGERYQHEQVTQFDIGAALGLHPDKAQMAKYAVGHSEKFCSRIPVLPGAQDAVAKLRENAEVYVITSPWNSCATWTSEREAWLKKHFDIPHARVLHGSAKHLVRGDVLIDDKDTTIIEWNKAHPGKTAVLWKAPWNMRAEWAGVHTNDWERVHRLVEALS